jgi:ABC1 atypical kinase-like domain
MTTYVITVLRKRRSSSFFSLGETGSTTSSCVTKVLQHRSKVQQVCEPHHNNNIVMRCHRRWWTTVTHNINNTNNRIPTMMKHQQSQFKHFHFPNNKSSMGTTPRRLFPPVPTTATRRFWYLDSQHFSRIATSSFWISSYYYGTTIGKTKCEDMILSPPPPEQQQQQQQQQQRAISLSSSWNEHDPSSSTTTTDKVVRYWRMLKRIIKLTITLSPIVVLYPFFLLGRYRRNKNKQKQIQNDDSALTTTTTTTTENNDVINHSILCRIQAEEDEMMMKNEWNHWYYQVCLYCVECSGACVIKLMQWASSRPDLFGNDFCSIFHKLQDNTIPHSWQHTEQLLIQYYGPNYHEFIQIPKQQKSIIGSGCIGQVYHGKVLVPASSLLSSNDVVSSQPTLDPVHDDSNKNDNTMVWQDVAIKVLHPTVEDDIAADLDLLRSMVSYLDGFPFCYIQELQKLKWLNLYGIVNELSRLLQLQMDLRNEGKNLLQFHHNFQNNPSIVFPQLIPSYPPQKHILIEEFCQDCIPILQYCRDNYQTNAKQLSTLCTIAT